MISGKILQSTLDGIHTITNAPIALYDKNGNAVFSTGDMKSMPIGTDIIAFLSDRFQSVQKNAALSKVLIDGEAEYVLAVGGDGDRKLIADLTALQLQSLGDAYREHLDKENFIKNLLLDNLLLVDIYNRARKFNIPESTRRVVILVECPAQDSHLARSRIEAAVGGNENDYITAVDDNYIILIKRLDDSMGYDEVHDSAAKAVKAVGRDIHAAYGTIVTELKDVSRSYKEAQMAVDIGKIFSPDSSVIAYSSLGIGRLIYQLPVPLCKMFIKEVFANRSPEIFDEETITTINKFFENNLNVSETSRQLYIHRNTLVYRLDKIYKMTGLDLRLFEDAITFRIALMVVRYMNYMKSQDQ